MKTLLLTLEYPPFKGGVANYYGNLIKYWPVADKIFVLNNNEKKLIKNWFWPKWLLAIWQLKRTVKKLGIQHVLVGHILPLGIVTYFSGVKYSVILHGLDFSLATAKAGRKKRLSRKILKKAENIICANSHTAGLVKDFLKNDISNNKIIVVNPGVSDQSKRDIKREAQIKKKYNLKNKFVILTVGRLVNRKGVDMVLKVLPKVLKQVSNLHYVIVGNGPGLGGIKKLITKFNLTNHVEIITRADDKNRNAWYNICDTFIMPARQIRNDFEGFGIVYLEANLASKPVIAGDSGGVRDAVQDNLNGLLVNPISLKEISASIINLASDGDLRKILGEQGKIRARDKFNWEKQVRLIYNALENKKAP